MCGRSSGAGGGDGGERSRGAGWTRASYQSVGSEAERSRIRFRDRDPRVGSTASRSLRPAPLLPPRRAGERPSRTLAMRDRPFLLPCIWCKLVAETARPRARVWFWTSEMVRKGCCLVLVGGRCCRRRNVYFTGAPIRRASLCFAIEKRKLRDRVSACVDPMQ
jgi:hypothetical protein